MCDMHYDWPVWRHDPALTGRSPLKGSLTKAPVVSWRYPLTGMRSEVFHPSQYVWGLLTLDGEKIWNLPGGDVPQVGVLPGLGDVDGDGKMALGAPFPDGFRCYEAATGKLRWTLKIPAGPYAGTVSADLDGDGRDEFLFAAHNRLVAIKSVGTEGKLLWQVELPGRLSEPIFADVDGDGQGEVLLTCEDGMLYCLDKEQPVVPRT